MKCEKYGFILAYNIIIITIANSRVFLPDSGINHNIYVHIMFMDA